MKIKDLKLFDTIKSKKDLLVYKVIDFIENHTKAMITQTGFDARIVDENFLNKYEFEIIDKK